MSTVQDLLDQEARMSNEGMDEEHPFRKIILTEIRQRRGNIAPQCFGNDDCSTNVLVQCPWRMDCGD